MTEKKTTPEIDVAYVAQLAKLKIDENKIGELQKDMENIVKYVDQLSELDLDNVEPTAHTMNSTNIWREDESKPSFTREEMTKNATELVNDELIKVPNVIPGNEG